MTWECDSNGHMNVMYYINKFEHAGRNFDLELQIAKSSREAKLGIVVIEHKINYLKEVFEDDLLYIKSSLKHVGIKSYTIFNEMFDGHTNQKVCTMRTVLALFNKETRKAVAIPLEKREELLAHL